MKPNFLQIHTLTGYAATLLNRDDIGRAKRLPFGGHDRIRVSSQCLKRHWRTQEGEWSLAKLVELDKLGISKSCRSRRIFSHIIAPRLRESFSDEQISDEQIVDVLRLIRAEVLGERKDTNKKGKKGKAATEESGNSFDKLKTEQVIVFGQPEIDFLVDLAKQLLQENPDNPKEDDIKAYFKDKENKKNLKAINAGFDAALFGRMVTSDLMARCDAAVHVAHSFTVHAEEAEPDYFSAVDDLVQEEGELGAGHINMTELTSGLFYTYVVVDLHLLVENLSKDRDLAAKVLQRLVHLIATVSPGAKLGATAPYACAELVLAEIGERQPRTLANAFMDPIRKYEAKAKAAKELDGYLQRFDTMYGQHEDRRFATMIEPTPSYGGKSVSLPDLAKWAAKQVEEAS